MQYFWGMNQIQLPCACQRHWLYNILHILVVWFGTVRHGSQQIDWPGCRCHECAWLKYLTMLLLMQRDQAMHVQDPDITGSPVWQCHLDAFCNRPCIDIAGKMICPTNNCTMRPVAQSRRAKSGHTYTWLKSLRRIHQVVYFRDSLGWGRLFSWPRKSWLGKINQFCYKKTEVGHGLAWQLSKWPLWLKRVGVCGTSPFLALALLMD